MEEGKEKKTRVYNKKKQNKKTVKPKIVSKPFVDIEETYLEEKKNEIPMYDPQTGDINPHYKELTGKENPMEIVRRESTFNKMDIKEYLKKNRFLVKLPTKFAIEPKDVVCISPSTVKKHLFGFTTYSDVVLKIMIPQKEKWKVNLINNINSKFSFDIEFLNSLIICESKEMYSNCKIKNYKVLPLSYCSDNMVEMILTIKVGKIKYQ